MEAWKLKRRVDKPNFLAGGLMLAFSLLGGSYLAWSLVRALSSGLSPGKLGAIHEAWSASYCVFIAACCIGIALAAFIALMGLRWAGIIKDARS